MFSLFHRQPFIRLNLEHPVLPQSPARSQDIVLLQSAAQAARDCAEIEYARAGREEREAHLRELAHAQRMEQQWAQPFRDR